MKPFKTTTLISIISKVGFDMEYYSKHFKEYIENTKNADMSELHEYFLTRLPPNSKRIMDLGFGSGRDSLFFRSKGFDVVSVDATPEFCEYGKQLGLDVFCMRAEDLDFDIAFDGIWACASLLHIPSKHLNNVFMRCNKALHENGIMYASFKYGEFEGNRNDRYFTDLNEESLTSIIQNTGFEIKDYVITNDVRPERNDKWLNVILKK